VGEAGDEADWSDSILVLDRALVEAVVVGAKVKLALAIPLIGVGGLIGSEGGEVPPLPLPLLLEDIVREKERERDCICGRKGVLTSRV